LHDLIGGLGEYRELLAALADQRVTPDEARARATRIDDDRDLGYLVTELEQATERSLDGLQRVARIVRATKDFARASSAKVPTDLNASLESTLVICRHETSTVAEIVTELGVLPLVMANAGEINQVFLIVIINAVHAIREVVEHTHRRGTISIKTWAQDGWVQIAITDTGTGIAPDVLDKIFEPFFTTKEVGEGTGQGLAIARSIVVGKHGGRLDVRSQVGSGSTFTIALPI
jgi:signal transduction histidine kinase